MGNSDISRFRLSQLHPVKKRILILRIVFILLSVIFVLLPTIVRAAVPEPTLTESEISTSGDAVFYFDYPVSNGTAVIQFFDENNEMIYETSAYFSSDNSDDKIATDYLYYIPDSATSYAVVSYSVEYYIDFPLYVFYILFSVTVILTIMFFFVFLKTYRYDDYLIEVYSGVVTHYLKVDGILIDKYKRFNSWELIWFDYILSDEDYLEVTISSSNIISTRINGIFLKPEKFFCNGDFCIEEDAYPEEEASPEIDVYFEAEASREEDIYSEAEASREEDIYSEAEKDTKS